MLLRYELWVVNYWNYKSGADEWQNQLYNQMKAWLSDL